MHNYSALYISELLNALLPLIAGVIICLFSYKDSIEMTATSKKGLFSEAHTQKLVDLMASEFENLKKL